MVVVEVMVLGVAVVVVVVLEVMIIHILVELNPHRVLCQFQKETVSLNTKPLQKYLDVMMSIT